KIGSSIRDLRSFDGKFARHIPRRLLERSKGKPVALKLTGIGVSGIPKGAFQVRIENAFLWRIRLKHNETPQDFAATDTTYPDWGDLAGKSLDVHVDRPGYVHRAVANINGFLGELVKLRQELGAHENRVVRLPAKFRGSSRNL